MSGGEEKLSPQQWPQMKCSVTFFLFDHMAEKSKVVVVGNVTKTRTATKTQ